MRRRKFLAWIGVSAVAWPLGVAAQQTGKVYRVGLLWDSPAMFPRAIEALRQGLREHGWIEGQNLSFEPRWSEGRFDLLSEFAQELARSGVDVIVAPSSIYAEAARRATMLLWQSDIRENPLPAMHVPEGVLTGMVRTAVIESSVSRTERKRVRTRARDRLFNGPWACRCCRPVL
jgi:putative tryptophan/tyrosine transport system substrate-binding protein